MKKFLLALALGAAAMPMMAQVELQVSTTAENNVVSGWQVVEDGATYTAPKHVKYLSDDEMWIVSADLYLKGVNNSSDDVEMTVSATLDSDNSQGINIANMLQICFGGSCQKDSAKADIPAGGATMGNPGEHIGFTDYKFEQADVDAIKLDAKYNVSVTCGDYKRSFILVFADETGSVEGLGAETAAPVYYNMQGMRIDAPVAGQICIVRQGDKITKRVF